MHVFSGPDSRVRVKLELEIGSDVVAKAANSFFQLSELSLREEPAELAQASGQTSPSEMLLGFPARRRPRTGWRDSSSLLAWEHPGVPPKELGEVAGERRLCVSQLGFR